MVLPFFDYLLVAASNPLDPPEISPPVLTVIIGLLGLVGAGILVLTFAKLWRDVLGKTPAIAVDIGTRAKDDKDARTEPGARRVEFDLTGLVATKDFEAHKEEARVRAVGLEMQISQLRHDWKEEMGSFAVHARDREEAAGEALDGINAKMGANGERLAKVETTAELILGMLRNLETKVDRHNERRGPATA